MRKRSPAPLAWLGGLLAVYLCAPLLASLPRIPAADWASVDWSALCGAAGVSAGSATAAAFVIAVGGIPLGYWLARRTSRWAAVVGFLVQLPLALPPLTSGILLLFLLGPYSFAGNLTNGALTDSFIGILLASVFVAAPFLIIAARSAFSAVDPILEDVAATLGHRPHARFFKVALPLAWPAIRAGLLLSWLRAFGEFGATVMVAYHPYSLPVYTYVAFGSQGLPAMMPIVLPTIALALAAAFLAASSPRLTRWSQQRSRVPDDLDGATIAPALQNTPPPPPRTRAGTSATSSPQLHFSFQKRIGTFDLDVTWSTRARRLAILGESGSGKSMTLRLLAGLEPADAATFSLAGENIATRPAEDRHIAYVPQDYGLFPHMTVTRQWSFARDSDPHSAQTWAAHLGLLGLEHRFPSELSLGQRQRVSIVRALARPCPLILLDEPFAALDTPRRKQLRMSLRQLQSEIDATTILVTHDPDEAALLADELMVIDQGKVLQTGPTKHVFGRPVSLQVANLLGLSNVGTGHARRKGLLDIGHGVLLTCLPHLHIQVRAGDPLMWRIDQDAVQWHASPLTNNASGTEPDASPAYHSVIVEDTVLRDGRDYLVVRLGAATLLLRNGVGEVVLGKTYFIAIAPEGIDIWVPAFPTPSANTRSADQAIAAL